MARPPQPDDQRGVRTGPSRINAASRRGAPTSRVEQHPHRPDPARDESEHAPVQCEQHAQLPVAFSRADPGLLLLDIFADTGHAARCGFTRGLRRNSAVCFRLLCRSTIRWTSCRLVAAYRWLVSTESGQAQSGSLDTICPAGCLSGSTFERLPAALRRRRVSHRRRINLRTTTSRRHSVPRINMRP